MTMDGKQAWFINFSSLLMLSKFLALDGVFVNCSEWHLTGGKLSGLYIHTHTHGYNYFYGGCSRRFYLLSHRHVPVDLICILCGWSIHFRLPTPSPSLHGLCSLLHSKDICWCSLLLHGKCGQLDIFGGARFDSSVAISSSVCSN